MNTKIKIIKFKIKGKIIFQYKYIKSSYRIRGNTPRIILIKNTIKLIYNHDHHNPIKLVNIPTIKYIKKIIISAIKIKANTPLKYSTLNPGTNSDSTKSIGLRFNPAYTLTKNTKNNGLNMSFHKIQKRISIP